MLRHSCFFDVLMVGKVDVPVNHPVGLPKGSWLVAVDSLCFEDEKDFFRQCVLIPSIGLDFDKFGLIESYNAVETNHYNAQTPA